MCKIPIIVVDRMDCPVFVISHGSSSSSSSASLQQGQESSASFLLVLCTNNSSRRAFVISCSQRSTSVIIFILYDTAVYASEPPLVQYLHINRGQHYKQYSSISIIVVDKQSNSSIELASIIDLLALLFILVYNRSLALLFILVCRAVDPHCSEYLPPFDCSQKYKRTGSLASTTTSLCHSTSHRPLPQPL